MSDWTKTFFQYHIGLRIISNIRLEKIYFPCRIGKEIYFQCQIGTKIISNVTFSSLYKGTANYSEITFSVGLEHLTSIVEEEN